MYLCRSNLMLGFSTLWWKTIILIILEITVVVGLGVVNEWLPVFAFHGYTKWKTSVNQG